MDIKDFLPLLMKNSAGSGAGNGAGMDMGGLLSALGNGDNSSLMQTLLTQAMGKDNKNSEMLTLLRLMQQNKTKPNQPQGFKPIFPFVAKDILGILVKHFNK